VLVEDGRFRMWYMAMPDARKDDASPDHPVVCYAESADGIHWQKPDLRFTGQRRYPGNNLLPLPGAIMGVVPALPETGAKYLACTIPIGPLDEDICDRFGYEFNGPGTYFWA
jgi:hypothetical protein